MKKGLWGYSVQEVNESMEFLEEQNASLARKVNKLTAELEQVQARLKEAGEAQSEAPAFSEDHARLAAQVERLEKKNKEWKSRAEQAEARLAPRQDGADELEQVSTICRKAYADMSQVKQAMHQKMEAVMAEFLSQWTESRDKMDRMYREMSDTRDTVKDSFITAADTILTRFDALEDDTRLLQEQLAAMDAAKDEVRLELEELLLPLEETAPLLEETVDPDKNALPEEDKPAILRAIRDRPQKAPSAPAAVIPAFRSEAEPDTDMAEASETGAGDLGESIGISIGISPKKVINK